jgi:hypothetical protein
MIFNCEELGKELYAYLDTHMAQQIFSLGHFVSLWIGDWKLRDKYFTI